MTGAPRAQALCAAVTLLTITTAIPAAEVFVQPGASITAEHDSNVELSPLAVNKQSATGYNADISTLIGIATPDSQTTLRPDLKYEYFPTDRSLNRLEGRLDLNTQFKWQRDKFTMLGRFDRRDDLNAEIADAVYNPVNPELPTPPGTGHVSLGIVRNDLLLLPDYSHSLTPLSNIGIAGTYEHLKYSPDDPFDHVEFNYYQAKPYYDYALSARAQLSFGVFASRYDAQNIVSRSTAYGTEMDMRYMWSPTWRGTLDLLYQQTTIDQTTPYVFHDKTNNWGATIGLTYFGPAGQLRMNAGRNILPSSGGALYNTDQVQLQYVRDVTQRLQFTGAVLYQRTGVLAANYVSDTRNYAITQLYLRWMVTRVWFVRGSYSYAWQRYTNDPASAQNNGISVQIGYLGLPRQ